VGACVRCSNGTIGPVDPATGAANALAFALYHPAAALRTPDIERTSYEDVARIPAALLEARSRREATDLPAATPVSEPAIAEARPTEPESPVSTPEPLPDPSFMAAADPAAPDDQLTLF